MTTLYLTDNAACRCGAHLGAHLGATAAASGHDISCQHIYRVTDADQQEMVATYGFPLQCEICRATTPPSAA